MQELDVERLEDLADHWRALADRGDNVFATYEWNAAWWAAFGGRRRLRIVGDGDALVPLYEAVRRPVRLLRLIGHGASDELGAVGASPGALRAGLAALGDGDLVLLDDIRDDVPGRELLVRPSPVVALEAVRWSRGLRQQLARIERRLGAVRFRVVEDLAAFRALHEARWGAGSRAFAGRWPLHERFAAAARERGWLRVHLLELDGRPAAALYNLRFGGVECFYQGGRDPSLDGVGLLLHAHAIRSAAAAGLREYRFLRGDEPYKRRFADRDRGVRTVGLARTVTGRALLRALAGVPALPRELRRQLPAAVAWGSGAAPARGGG